MKKLSTNERKTKENNKYRKKDKLVLVFSLTTLILSLLVILVSGFYLLVNKPYVIISIGISVILSYIVIMSLDNVLEYVNK